MQLEYASARVVCATPRLFMAASLLTCHAWIPFPPPSSPPAMLLLQDEQELFQLRPFTEASAGAKAMAVSGEERIPPGFVGGCQGPLWLTYRWRQTFAVLFQQPARLTQAPVCLPRPPELLPPRERPKTTAAVARLMLSHALGMRDLRDRGAERDLAAQRKVCGCPCAGRGIGAWVCGVSVVLFQTDHDLETESSPWVGICAGPPAAAREHRGRHTRHGGSVFTPLCMRSKHDQRDMSGVTMIGAYQWRRA